jgi:predicted CopG family antitoxin
LLVGRIDDFDGVVALAIGSDLCIDLCMATKTISVDLEAYQHLCRAKTSEKESFSQVIRRAVWKPKAGTGGQLLAELRATDSAEALDKSAIKNLEHWQEDDAVAPDRWADAG